MGPFSYIPFMECNHAILNMKSTANGSITINNHQMQFTHGTSYIEKDWGSTFPKYYIWCQGNNFKNPNASFMVSIADIPFKAFSFKSISASVTVTLKQDNNVIFSDTSTNCGLEIVLDN